jgi:hypothetical protein
MKRDGLLYPLLAIIFSVAASCATHKQPSPSSANTAMTEVTGQLVPASGNRSEPIKFKTDSGTVYTLASNRMSSALFTDTNLQAKVLLLKGRTAGERFEVTGNLRSIRDGVVHDLYYYCDICAIRGIDPGPCMCCREPVHLLEEPAK